jgi:hypothetical protein
VHNKAGFLALVVGVALAATLAAAAVARPLQDEDMRAVIPGPVLMGHTIRERRINPRLTRRYRRVTWHWEAVMGRRRSRLALPLHTRTALVFWSKRAKRARRQASRPPHRDAWLCIHRYEATWSDSGDPYWGGLQMDRSFMRHYAPRPLLRRGWANRWTALEQMWVAEHAFRRGRGFYPWPNTARACGLI